MEKNRTKGFVFKRDNRFESDKMFSIFSQDYGRIEVLGKSMRKIDSKLRSGIDIFSFSEIEFIETKNGKTLTDTNLLFKTQRTLENFNFAQRISILLDSFIRGQEKDDSLYNLLIEVFQDIDNFKNKDLAYYYFVWNFLSIQGYKVQIEKCCFCGGNNNGKDAFFSKNMNGIICSKCANNNNAYKIDEDIVKLLKVIFNKNFKFFREISIEDKSIKLLNSFANNVVGSLCPS